MKWSLNDSKYKCGKSQYKTPQYLNYTCTGSVSCSFQEQSAFSTEQHVLKSRLEHGSSWDSDSSQDPDLQKASVHWLLLALQSCTFAYDWLSVCIHIENAHMELEPIKGEVANQRKEIKNLLYLGRFKAKPLVSSPSPLPLCCSKREIERKLIKYKLIWSLTLMNI